VEFALIACDNCNTLKFSFQAVVTPVGYGIVSLHHYILFFILTVLLFVFYVFSNILALSRSSDLLGNMQFYESDIRVTAYIQHVVDFIRHKTIRRLEHHMTLEIWWTVIPSIILLLIAVPSFALLYAMEEIIDPGLTIRIIGHQWY
jgi:cytochrome c oxidase subunit 2